MGTLDKVSRTMRRLIFLLLLTSYCCFAQKTVQQLETEFLSELVDVHRRVKSVEDQNKNLIEENDKKENRIQALEGKVEKLQQKSELQKIVIVKLSTEVEDLKVQLNDTNKEIKGYANHFEDIEETLNHFDEIDAKMENLELKTAPESCLNLVNQGLNHSQTTLLDPDGNNHGAVPIPIFCQLPEAIAISGEEIEIAMDFDSAESGVFKHVIEYDENTMKQLTALTTISSKCTQGFEFHCFLAPLKDLVKEIDLLSWIDRFGSSHIVENLGQNLCNAKNPVWPIDSETIEDQTLLPITGFTYKGIEFEIQKATVKIGALNCYPPENQYNMKKHLESLEQRTNDTNKRNNIHEALINKHESLINDHGTKIEGNRITIRKNANRISRRANTIATNTDKIDEMKKTVLFSALKTSGGSIHS